MDLAITRSWIRKSFHPTVHRYPTEYDQPTSVGEHLPFSPSIRPDQHHRHQGHHQPDLQPKAPLSIRDFPTRIYFIKRRYRLSAPPMSTTRSPCLAIEIPETLFLDVARLGIYTTDAVDLTAIYMLLLLYRQLVFSETSRAGWDGKGKAGRKIVEAELVKLKSEIWAVAPPRLGSCFIPEARRLDCLGASSRHDRDRSEDGSERRDKKERSRARSSKSELERWRKGIRDVALHVAARSKDVEWRAEAASTQTSSIPRLATPESVRPTAPPDTAILGLVERWCESNLKFGSPLSVLLREKLADAMLHMVMACYHNVNNLAPPSRPTPISVSVSRDSQGAPRVRTKPGCYSISRRTRWLAAVWAWRR
jgi:hypothetical protein